MTTNDMYSYISLLIGLVMVVTSFNLHTHLFIFYIYIYIYIYYYIYILLYIECWLEEWYSHSRPRVYRAHVITTELSGRMMRSA